MSTEAVIPASPILLPMGDVVSRTDLIVDAIRDAILSGRLEPGQALVERDLALLLRVSKTPIREALKVLSRTGLVTAVPYRGTTVREVSSQLAESLYDVRLLLEPTAIAKAISSNTPSVLREARSALQQAAEAGARKDLAGLNLSNRRFHHLLYAQCGNTILVSMLNAVEDQAALIISYCWRRRMTWPSEAAQHEGILAAVEARDEAMAQRLCFEHISQSRRVILDTLEAIGPAAAMNADLKAKSVATVLNP
jgi:DNA-binding GntR family transcriptional regulator